MVFSERFRRICVYCGASPSAAPVYFEAARELGRFLAEQQIDLVYGGGRVGLMGAVADSCLEAGGRVYGVIPRKLVELEVAHQGCTELFVVDGMHSRKMMMAQLADAFIALPGGWGTLEELFEMTTWAQLNYHRKPIGVLNVNGYYDPLFEWLEKAQSERFIREIHGDLVQKSASVPDLMSLLFVQQIPEFHRDRSSSEATE